LGRKLADTSSQQKLLKGLAETFGLPRVPQRIEVYDNSHIQGANAVGAMIVAGAEGLRRNQYRKFNIGSSELTPGDDFDMRRELLERRFKRLMTEAPRAAPPATGIAEAITVAAISGEAILGDMPPPAEPDDDRESPWPDLVLIDGGQGQLNAAR